MFCEWEAVKSPTEIVCSERSVALVPTLITAFASFVPVSQDNTAELKVGEAARLLIDHKVGPNNVVAEITELVTLLPCSSVAVIWKKYGVTSWRPVTFCECEADKFGTWIVCNERSVADSPTFSTAFVSFVPVSHVTCAELNVGATARLLIVQSVGPSRVFTEIISLVSERPLLSVAVTWKK